MSTQLHLLPSLYALVPPSAHPQLLAHLSLRSLHVEPYHLVESTYAAEHTVIPNQPRFLRLRAVWRLASNSSGKGNGKGKAKALGGDAGGWKYSLSYLSSPLLGSEYMEMNVRACISVDIADISSRREIEEFIETLGFRHSHTITRRGYMFHLSLPTQSSTLHLSVTRVLSPSPGESADRAETSEPYLVELTPAKPIQAVASRGEPGIQDVMLMMRDTADRMDGLDWGTGR